MQPISSQQFILWRKLFAIFLFAQMLTVLPHIKEIFSDQGIFPQHSIMDLSILFPLGFFRSELLLLQIVVSISVGCSVLLFFGIQRRLSAFLLWYIIVNLIYCNPFIQNISFAYTGWLLLVLATLPSGEEQNLNWKIPKIIVTGAWSILAFSYFISGLDKLNSPNWVNGSAITKIMNLPLARVSFLQEILLHSPKLAKFLTWEVLLLELLFLPLLFSSMTRRYVWLAMLFVHIGIAFTTKIAELSIGIIIFHLFVLPPEWFACIANSRIHSFLHARKKAQS